MKRGQKVAVCYDGKWGRRVPGIVTGTRNGHHIQVRFVPRYTDDEKEIEAWFRAKKRGRKYGRAPKYFGGWVRSDNALMPILFPLFGATAPGDWYTVHKWRERR